MARARGATAPQYEGIERNDRADLAEKEPGDLHVRMQRYIKFRTGYDADLKTVQIVRVLLTHFQASPEEQAIRAEQADARAQNDGQPEPAPAPKRGRSKAQTEQAQPAAQPARRGRGKGTQAQASAAPAPARGRGRGRGKGQQAQTEAPPEATSGGGEQEPF